MVIYSGKDIKPEFAGDFGVAFGGKGMRVLTCAPVAYIQSLYSLFNKDTLRVYQRINQAALELIKGQHHEMLFKGKYAADVFGSIDDCILAPEELSK